MNIRDYLMESLGEYETQAHPEIGCDITTSKDVSYNIDGDVVHIVATGDNNQIHFTATDKSVNLNLDVTGKVFIFVEGSKLQDLTISSTGDLIERLVIGGVYEGDKNLKNLDITGVHDCRSFIFTDNRKVANLIIPEWSSCYIRLEKLGLSSLDMSKMNNCDGGFIIKCRSLNEIKMCRSVSGNLQLSGGDLQATDLDGLKTVGDRGVVWMDRPNKWSITRQADYFYDKSGNLKKPYQTYFYIKGNKITPLPTQK